jgi:hypothetical protein
MHAVAGIAGGCLFAVVMIAYLGEVIRGQVRPHWLTWGTWSLIAIVALAANLAAGGGGLVAIPFGVVTIGTIGVFICSLQTRDQEAPISAIVPALVVLGLVAWLLLADPLLAALAAVIADASAALPTVRRTWRQPSSEPALLWGFGSLAGLCSIGALAQLHLATLVYPIYLFAFDATMTALTLRAQHHDQAPDRL